MGKRGGPSTTATTTTTLADVPEDRVQDECDLKPTTWYVEATDSEADTHRAMLVQWLFVGAVLLGGMYWWYFLGGGPGQLEL